MNKKNAEKQPDQSSPEKLEEAASPAADSGAASPKQDKPQPSRSRLFFRKMLIWLVIIAVAFTAGIAADHFLRYKPLLAAQVEAEDALDQAQQDLSDLQIENDRLDILNQDAGVQIAKLETEKKALQDELDTTVTHLELLQVLVDVSSARVALFLENVKDAKTYLVKTQERLDDLLPHIAEYDPALAQDMPQRLNLIISGLERDTENAKIDLELITKDLLNIEEAVFGN